MNAAMRNMERLDTGEDLHEIDEKEGEEHFFMGEE